MRVLVVGAGAVGTLLGWAAATGGAEAILVRRRHDGPPVDDQIAVIGLDGRRTQARVQSCSPTALETTVPDLCVVTVKQPDVPDALRSLVALPEVPVVTVENGIGAEELAASMRPRGALLAASLTASVHLEPDGSVRWLRRGGLGLAPVRGDARAIGDRFLAAITAAGLPGRWYPDAEAMKWSKCLANLVGNATSAILDMDPAAIYRDARLFPIEREQLREALAVMAALGRKPVDLPGARVRLLVSAVGLPGIVGRLALSQVIGRARGGKDPSLRIALRTDGGGPTEVAWLNGAVAKAAEHLGVPAPINRGLAALVEEARADRERRDWFRGRPDRLLEALGGA